MAKFERIAIHMSGLIIHYQLKGHLLKTLRDRSALRNPCEGCHNLHRREGAVGPYGQARQDVTFALRSKLCEMSFWGHQGVPLVSGTNAPSCVPEMLMSYTKDIVDYRE